MFNTFETKFQGRFRTYGTSIRNGLQQRAIPVLFRKTNSCLQQSHLPVPPLHEHFSVHTPTESTQQRCLGRADKVEEVLPEIKGAEPNHSRTPL